MANKQVFPTKGNLIATKKSNDLAHMGYELMDRKRNILTREMMSLMDDVKLLRDKITITYRSVMGVEIPKIQYDKQEYKLTYGLDHANSKLDYAYRCFYKVKEMTVILAEVENSVYRLANAIRKAQKRANALKNIVIPDFEHNIKFITDALEEKEREEFSRQKVIKATKDRRKAEESATQCHQLKVS